MYLCIVCMMLGVPLCGEARTGLASLELDLETHGFWDSYPDFYKKAACAFKHRVMSPAPEMRILCLKNG